jgi:hypothetical protein
MEGATLDHLHPISDMADEETPARTIGGIQPVRRRPRKNCLLTAGEHLAIEPFKERYRSEPLRERRVAIVKSEILVAYFNYLDSQNAAPRSPDELYKKTKVCDVICIPVLTTNYSVQFLVNWIANNWQSRTWPDMSGLSLNVCAIDLVWRMRKEDCEDELRLLLGVEELDRASNEYFQNHRTAAKIVLDQLTVAEQEQLDAKIAAIQTKGHDKETQQQ